MRTVNRIKIESRKSPCEARLERLAITVLPEHITGE